MRFIGVFMAGLLTLIVGDLIWLGVLMRDFYAYHLGHLMAADVTWAAAVLFYLSYTFAVLWFVVRPHWKKSLQTQALNGALFGALAYAVYDFTNQATLMNWPWIVTFSDIAWGGFLTMLMSVAMRETATRLLKK